MAGDVNPRRLGYPDEVRVRAVILVRVHGWSNNAVARLLRVNPKTIRHWLETVASPERPPVRRLPPLSAPRDPYENWYGWMD